MELYAIGFISGIVGTVIFMFAVKWVLDQDGDNDDKNHVNTKLGERL